MSCVAVFCKSRAIRNGKIVPGISFHAFPKDPEQRAKWVKAIRRRNWQPTQHSRLCSKHFEESCFIQDISIKKLKPHSVPTIFEGYPKYNQGANKTRQITRRSNRRLPVKQETHVVPVKLVKQETRVVPDIVVPNVVVPDYIPQATPRKWNRKIMEYEGVVLIPDNFPSTKQVDKLVRSLSKYKKLAMKRLKVLKCVREMNRKLKMKVEKLSNKISELTMNQSNVYVIQLDE